MRSARSVLLTSVLLSLLLSSASASNVAEAGPNANNYVFRRSWGAEGDQLRDPYGVAVGPDGTIYVANTGFNRITRISPAERTFSMWGGHGFGNGQFWSPRGIAVDGSGNVYVADTLNNRIQKFNRSGVYLTHWGSAGSGTGQLSAPYGIVVDGSGDIYVADTVNYRIQKFSSNGAYLMQWGSQGSGSGQFDFPTGIAVDRDGNVYVVDTRNHRVQKFSGSGAYLTQWGSLGSGNGQFNRPEDVAVDGSGNVYVADRDNDRIQKFTSDGVYLMQWGSQGSGIGQFIWPKGIAVDSDGNVYVADSNSRIQKFTSNGGFLTQWGSLGSGIGQFDTPYGIAVDSNGNVYVADSGNSRIQMFSDGYPAPDPLSGLVLNGSFESAPALSEWTYGGSLSASQSTHAVQGTYSALLGAAVPQQDQGEGQAWAHQTFYVDPTWSRPVLSFAYNMRVNDIRDYSDFFVAIQDGVGLNHLATVVRDGYQPCIPGVAPAAGADLGWRMVSYDLSVYKGQSIRLAFYNRNLWPNSWGIWTYVDDVRVVDAGPVSPVDGPYKVYLPIASSHRCDPVSFTALSGSTLLPVAQRPPTP